MSVLDEIEDILASLLKVKGLIGVVFTDAQGEIIGARMPPKYRRDCQNYLVSTVLKLKSNLEELDFCFSELTYHYHETRVVVYDLEYGALFVLCLSSISLPLINLSIKSPGKKLARILKNLT